MVVLHQISTTFDPFDCKKIGHFVNE